MAAQQLASTSAAFVRPQGQPDLSVALQPYDADAGQRAPPRICCGGPASAERPTRFVDYAAMSASDAAAIAGGGSVGRTRSRRRGSPASMADRCDRARSEASAETARESRSSSRCSCGGSNRMLTTPAPLQEKMTLYFHGHFTSRATPRFPRITYNQNALFRRIRARQSARSYARRSRKTPRC